MFEGWAFGISKWPNLEAERKAVGLSRSFNNQVTLANREMGVGVGIEAQAEVWSPSRLKGMHSSSLLPGLRSI